MTCILLTDSGLPIARVTLNNVARGDKIQTKRGEGTVEDIQFGESFTYITLSF